MITDTTPGDKERRQQAMSARLRFNLEAALTAYFIQKSKDKPLSDDDLEKLVRLAMDAIDGASTIYSERD